MKCEDFGKYLDNFETLSEREKSDMFLHAEKCEECRKELEFFTSMLNTVRSLPPIEPPADFMERLNERLDKEDEKVIKPSGVLYHVRRNWMQYSALAACFALVAVLTANSGIFFDHTPKPETDDVIIGTDTTAQQGSGDASGAADNGVSEADKAKIAEANAAVDKLDPSYVAGGTLIASNNANNSNKAANANTSGRTVSYAAQSVSSVRTGTSSASAAVSAAPAQTESAPAVHEETGETVYEAPAAAEAAAVAEKTEKASSNVKDDYGIALSSNTRTMETASYDVRVEEVRRDDIASGYTLADTSAVNDDIAQGRYYKLDKNGNPVTEDTEAKAVGSLRIAAADADKAMEIISNYPHGEDGDLYTTDSGHFSLMLSMLSTEGISYTNYTPAGGGDVQFRIIIN